MNQFSPPILFSTIIILSKYRLSPIFFSVVIGYRDTAFRYRFIGYRDKVFRYLAHHCVGPPLKRHSDNCRGTPTQQASSTVVAPLAAWPWDPHSRDNSLKYMHTHSVCPLKKAFLRLPWNYYLRCVPIHVTPLKKAF